jgi:hypothetical protein
MRLFQGQSSFARTENHRLPAGARKERDTDRAVRRAGCEAAPQPERIWFLRLFPPACVVRLIFQVPGDRSFRWSIEK